MGWDGGEVEVSFIYRGLQLFLEWGAKGEIVKPRKGVS